MRRLGLSILVMPVIMLACARKTDDVADDTSSSTSTETETGEEPLECADPMRCNPLDLDDCPESEMCVFFNTEFQCLPFTGDGGGVAGAQCDSATDCNPGLACIQGVFFTNCAGAACCSPNCNVDAANTCPNAAAGEICDPWMLGDGADPCYVNVGVCLTQP
jgi:hypothetical protein